MKSGDIIKTPNGEVLLVEYICYDKSKFRFIDTGFEFKSSISNVKNGSIRDYLKPQVFGVGFKGYKGKMNDRERRIYYIWRQMLSRCLSQSNPSYEGYSDCEVSSEWHNFKNFLDWYVKESRGRDDLHLDKDIKVKGCRLYSPDTCSLVTRKENNRERKNMRPHIFISPDGEEVIVRNRKLFAEENGLNRTCLNDLVAGRQKTHKGWTFKCYV